MKYYCPQHGREYHYPHPPDNSKNAPAGICQICFYRFGRFMPLHREEAQAEEVSKKDVKE